MISWIKNNFGMKNFIILVSVIVVIAAALLTPTCLKFFKKTNYEGVAEAKITNMQPKTASYQNYNGASVKTIGYDITFAFIVQNKRYSKTESVTTNYTNNQIFTKFIAGEACNIAIKYAIDNPSESVITNLNPK